MITESQILRHVAMVASGKRRTSGARAVFECRIIVKQALGSLNDEVDDALHAFEQALYREVETGGVKP